MRARLWSRLARMYLREPPPWPYGPGHMSQPAFDEISSSSRYGLKSSLKWRPKFASALAYGGPEVFARSKGVSPRSKAERRMWRFVEDGVGAAKVAHQPSDIAGNLSP